MTEQDPFASVAPFLRPRVLLFLSVDLVGSTAVKQAPKFPISTPDDYLRQGQFSQPWLSPIADFYAQFGKVFERNWVDYNLNRRDKVGFPQGPDPELWKANGDELIYVKKITDRRDLYGCMDAWIRTIRDYRQQFTMSSRLDVKSTAWTAGFPVTNSEIAFARVVDRGDVEYEDDPRLRMFHLLDKWHSSSGPKGTIYLTEHTGYETISAKETNHGTQSQRSHLSR